MEKIANFLVALFWGLYERVQGKKAADERAASVRADPASAWLRRFGGRDKRSNSAGSGDAGPGSD